MLKLKVNISNGNLLSSIAEAVRSSIIEESKVWASPSDLKIMNGEINSMSQRDLLKASVGADIEFEGKQEDEMQVLGLSNAFGWLYTFKVK